MLRHMMRRCGGRHDSSAFRLVAARPSGGRGRSGGSRPGRRAGAGVRPGRGRRGDVLEGRGAYPAAELPGLPPAGLHRSDVVAELRRRPALERPHQDQGRRPGDAALPVRQGHRHPGAAVRPATVRRRHRDRGRVGRRRRSAGRPGRHARAGRLARPRPVAAGRAVRRARSRGARQALLGARGRLGPLVGAAGGDPPREGSLCQGDRGEAVGRRARGGAPRQHDPLCAGRGRRAHQPERRPIHGICRRQAGRGDSRRRRPAAARQLPGALVGPLLPNGRGGRERGDRARLLVPPGGLPARLRAGPRQLPAGRRPGDRAGTAAP